MATPRQELESFLQGFNGWNSPHADKCQELLNQLNLLGITRRNISHYLVQAHKYGGIRFAPLIIQNSLPGLWSDDARIRRAYTELAQKYQKNFPGLDTEIQTIPEDFPQINENPNL